MLYFAQNFVRKLPEFFQNEPSKNLQINFAKFLQILLILLTLTYGRGDLLQLPPVRLALVGLLDGCPDGDDLATRRDANSQAAQSRGFPCEERFFSETSLEFRTE